MDYFIMTESEDYGGDAPGRYISLWRETAFSKTAALDKFADRLSREGLSFVRGVIGIGSGESGGQRVDRVQAHIQENIDGSLTWRLELAAGYTIVKLPLDGAHSAIMTLEATAPPFEVGDLVTISPGCIPNRFDTDVTIPAGKVVSIANAERARTPDTRGLKCEVKVQTPLPDGAGTEKWWYDRSQLTKVMGY